MIIEKFRFLAEGETFKMDNKGELRKLLKIAVADREDIDIYNIIALKSNLWLFYPTRTS